MTEFLNKSTHMPKWQLWAKQLASYIGADSFHPSVVTGLRSHLQANWGLACSGGADSVCMALMVWACFAAQRERMVVLHYHHGIRGDAADGDEQLVREISDDLGLALRVGRREGGPGIALSEDALRRDRMAFFEASGCACIITGHHLNDVAETLWMRLLRGSGLDGLAAPRPVSDSGYAFKLFRPLLNVKRDTLAAALQQCGVPWREDGSNASPVYLRNRVRSQLIPVLDVLSERDAVQAAGRTRRVLQEDADTLNALAQALFAKANTAKGLHGAEMQGQGRALWRRVLRLWLNAQASLGPISAEAFEQLLERWRLGEPFQQSAGPLAWFQLNAGYLHLTAIDGDTEALAWVAFEAEAGKAYPLPDAKVFCIERVTLDDALRERIIGGQIDPAHEVFVGVKNDDPPTVWVRPWRDGDKIKHLGAPGRRKLQDIFVDKKITAQERRTRPVVCAINDDILWCPGIPPSAAHKITPESKWALRLTYQSTS